MNLFLIGYRGSGKSTIGPLIAERLGWTTADSDHIVESNANLTIAEIFAKHGEPEFRKLEQSAIRLLASNSNSVISLGGGAAMFPANQLAIRQSGKAVYLEGSWDVLWRRISGDKATSQQRPDLTNKGGADEVRELLEKRHPTYEVCADYKINVDSDSPEEIADRIVKWFRSDDKDE